MYWVLARSFFQSCVLASSQEVELPELVTKELQMSSKMERWGAEERAVKETDSEHDGSFVHRTCNSSYWNWQWLFSKCRVDPYIWSQFGAAYLFLFFGSEVQLDVWTWIRCTLNLKADNAWHRALLPHTVNCVDLNRNCSAHKVWAIQERGRMGQRCLVYLGFFSVSPRHLAAKSRRRQALWGRAREMGRVFVFPLTLIFWKCEYFWTSHSRFEAPLSADGIRGQTKRFVEYVHDRQCHLIWSL